MKMFPNNKQKSADFDIVQQIQMVPMIPNNVQHNNLTYSSPNLISQRKLMSFHKNFSLTLQN